MRREGEKEARIMNYHNIKIFFCKAENHHLHPSFVHSVIHSFFTRNINQTGRAGTGGGRKKA